MVKEELYINGENVELLESLNPNLTFNIADIANPDQRKADFSKTITLPASKKINKIFEHIFDVNTDLQTFNPNLRTDVVYLVNGEVQLDGYLQIKSIKNNNKEINYECVIIGRVGNFFSELQEQELTDLDFSSLNHTYTKANQVATWNFPLTTDYCYPMINYDINYGGLTTSENWSVTDFFPAIKVKKYIDTIFSSIGYTYTSSFFTSSYFNTLIIPFSSKDFKLSESAINNLIFSASNPKFLGTGTGSSNSFNGVYDDTTTFQSDTIVNQTEAYDAGGVYDNTTGVFTAGSAAYYNINCMAQLQGEFNSPIPSPTVGTQYTLVSDIHGKIKLNKYNSSGGFISTIDEQFFGIQGSNTPVNPNTTITTSSNPTTSSNEYYVGSLINPAYVIIDNLNNASTPNKFYVSANNIYLNSGEKVKLVVEYECRGNDIKLSTNINFNFNQSNVFWKDSGNNLYDARSFGLNILSSYFNNEIVNSTYVEGSNIDMSSSIPAKVKQRDFIKSLVNMFNLYIQPNPDDEKDLIIEPRDDFYNNDVIDWSGKIDKSKDIEFLPMGALNSKEYLYTYKKDNDYYNNLYYNTWDEVYGQADFIINNDFLKAEHKTEVIFSPTPSVGQSWYDRVIPTIIKFDDKNGVQRTEANIRILQWGGLKSTDQQWLHVDSSADTIKTDYPYAGMYNDPYSPSEDIGFNLTNEIYWSNVFNNVITFSNNNLYNKYYKKFIEEITDTNSKIVNAYFYLTPSDITNLSFRKQYYFEGQYFRLNKVENYNPSNPITKCEFLKIKEATVFSPSTQTSHGGNQTISGKRTPTFGQGTGTLTNGNSVGNRGVTTTGSDNYVSGTVEGATISGSNNSVFSGAKNVIIQGDGNTVESGVKNVQLINSNNQTVTQSNIMYINDEIQGTGSFETVNTNFIPNENIKTYLIDTQGGNVTASFAAVYGTSFPYFPHVGKIWTFKKLHSQHQAIVDATGLLTTIDGNSTYTLSSNNDSVTMMWDGQQFNII